MITTVRKIIIGLLCVLFISISPLNAQNTNNDEVGRLSTVSTAVPFLRITPDARSGAMGDVGIGLSADANATFYNAAKIPFSDKDLGLSFSYSPWLRSLGISDIFLAHLAAYYKIGELQSISLSLKYFNLGNITFTNIQGDFITEFKPREFAIDVAYARRLSDNFSLGLGLRYIYSNLAAGQSVNGNEITAGNAVGADISFFYRKPLSIGKNDLDGTVRFGTTLSNIGSKISYSNDAINQDFIPANLGIGVGFDMYPNELHNVGIYFDINKLLVPSPIDTDLDNDGSMDAQFDENNNGVADYKEQSSISALFTSFADADGGFKEELREFNISVGAEYGYNDLFFLRLGYFYEHPTKGNRKYFTAGLGVKYNVFGLDFSYLVPTSSERNPLDNTLRFTLKFDFDDLGGNRNNDEELLLE
ncbi:MAG: type IX secretion system outer membrane channel protein PorV [Chitinophagales bacterium]